MNGAGRPGWQGRKLQTLDEGAVMVKAREWAAKAKEHATVPPVAAA